MCTFSEQQLYYILGGCIKKIPDYQRHSWGIEFDCIRKVPNGEGKIKCIITEFELLNCVLIRGWPLVRLAVYRGTTVLLFERICTKRFCLHNNLIQPQEMLLRIFYCDHFKNQVLSLNAQPTIKYQQAQSKGFIRQKAHTLKQLPYRCTNTLQ